VKFWLINFCFQTISLALFRSYRFKYINKSNLNKARELSGGVGAVLVTWHGNSFVGTLGHAHQKVAPLASFSPDGMLVINLCRKIGLEPVAGSSSKGGAQALHNLNERIKAGDHVAITVDGPRGPIYKPKPGCADIARNTGACIVPMRAYAENSWQLKSWDRLKIPKPFSTVKVVYGEPFRIPKTADGKIFKMCLEKVETSLNQLENIKT
jgi:lysophospholipid acyltransferase (LPLAT)-like uncharacterized protein